MNEEQAALWKRYESDPSALGDLMLSYEDIVESTALAMSKTLPKHIELQDLVADGYFGLADAIQKFDKSFGYKFETYASFRIRGEILDWLRKADWAPRSLRSKNKEIAVAKNALAEELAREPTVDEIATLLGWDLESVYQVTGETAQASIQNLDDLVNVNGVKFSLSEILPDQSQIVGDDFVELKETMINAIGELSHEAVTILSLYYVEELPLREIGDLMTVTESRACQIHTNALEFLWKTCVPN